MVKFFEWMHKNGYVEAWFKWIEWVTLTAVLFAVGWKADMWPVFVLGLFSSFLVYAHAVKSMSTITGSLLKPFRLPQLLVWPIAAAAALVISVGIMVILCLAIAALVRA